MSGLARCQTRIASWGSRGVLSPTYLTISSRPLVTSHEQARCPRRHGTNQPGSPALPEPAGHRPEPSPALRTCARLRGRVVRAASRRGASRPNASRRGAACGSHVAQTAPFRYVAYAECAFPHLGKRGAGSRKSALCPDELTEKRILARTHRARLTKKRTLAAPPGRTSPKDALWLRRHLQNASLREASYEKTHSDRSGARKMRFSVTSNSRVRFSVECAFPHLGKCGAGSRKSALCNLRLTEKAHSALIDSRKAALCDSQIAQTAPFRYIAAPGKCGATPPASLRGTMENASTGQTRSSNPPPACGGVAPGPVGPGLGPGCTEGRSLGRGPR